MKSKNLFPTLSSLDNLKQEEFIDQPTISHSFSNSVVTNDQEKVSTISETNMEALQAKIDSILENDITGEYKCTVCGKTTKGKDAKRNIRRHIETHIEGVAHPCNQCEKVSRSSHSLEKHISRYHRK